MEGKTVDSVLETIPVSYFHYRLLVICGLAFMADAMEVSLLSYLSTCAGDEWNLDNAQKAAITSVVFAGEMAGSLFWGPIADKFGRKIAFLLACSLISVGGFLSGASPSYGWLLFFRAVVGFGVGGLNVPFDLLAEFVPVSHRGTFLMNIEYFWTFGSLFVNGVAWGMLSQSGWRALAYITAVPVTVASLACFWFLPESPRWLLINGRKDEAEKILRDVARFSGVDLQAFNLVNDGESNSTSEGVYIDLVKTPAARRLSFPLWAVWMTFGFTYYGIILLVTRLYTAASTSASGDDGSTCNFTYSFIFINSCSELVGVFLASIVIDRWGRSRTQTVFYLLAGFSVALMGIKQGVASVTAIAFIGRMGAMAASSGTWVSTPELYPTETRATGHAVCNSAARIGGFLTPFLVVSDVSIAGVAVILGLLNCFAGVMASLLPETADDLLKFQVILFIFVCTINCRGWKSLGMSLEAAVRRSQLIAEESTSIFGNQGPTFNSSFKRRNESQTPSQSEQGNDLQIEILSDGHSHSALNPLTTTPSSECGAR